MKHADGFHGVDRYIAERIGFGRMLKSDKWAFWPGDEVEAKMVLFGGVGPLWEFRYEAIRHFAKAALLEIAERHSNRAMWLARFMDPVMDSM